MSKILKKKSKTQFARFGEFAEASIFF